MSTPKKITFTEKLTTRIRELVDLPMDSLRLEYPENLENANQAREWTRGMTRGQLVEAIILDEFDWEFNSIYLEFDDNL